MSNAKVQPEDDVQFLLASPVQFTRTEAARVQPEQSTPPAHDSFHRLWTALEPDPEALWLEARPQIQLDDVQLDDGVLILDDSTLDKPYARQSDLVGWHWSGKHHRVVKGLNLLTLLWTDGDRHVPCDYDLYDKAHDGFSKNDLFAQQLRTAQERGLNPKCVGFDSWFSSLENLKLIRSLGGTWLGRLQSNRQVRVDFGAAQPLSTVDLSTQGRVVPLPGYGPIRVFRVVATNGDTDHGATNDWGVDPLTRLKDADFSWRLEEYHRGIKQFCGVERCQARSATAQRNHSGWSLRAFLRLEGHCFALGLSWFQAKLDVICPAVRTYLANPSMRLSKVA